MQCMYTKIRDRCAAIAGNHGHHRLAGIIGATTREPPGIRFQRIFQYFRTIPLPSRVSLLKDFFSLFPDIPASDIAIEVASLSGINWFQVDEPISYANIQELIYAYCQSLKKQPMKLIMIERDWKDADEALLNLRRDNERKEMENYIWESTPKSIRYVRTILDDVGIGLARIGPSMAPKSSEDVVLYAMRQAAIDLSEHLSFILVQDLLIHQANPFSPLIEMWKNGLWPMGELSSFRDEFAVFLP